MELTLHTQNVIDHEYAWEPNTDASNFYEAE